MTRTDPLALWEETSQDILAVLRDLEPEDHDRPCLPGWSVRDLLAHLAHLESAAAEMDQPAEGSVEVESKPNQAMPPAVTETGVAARRDRSPAELLAEFEEACRRRRELLADLDTSDPGAPAPGLVGELGWDVRTMLRNRPIDLWVHEQDIRAATGRGVTTTGAGAVHVADLMTKAFPIALRGLPQGTGVIAKISGPRGRVLAARVGEDGRAAPFDPEAAPRTPEEGDATVLEMDDVTWLRLTEGRLDPTDVPVAVTGDEEVAATVLRQLNVTP